RARILLEKRIYAEQRTGGGIHVQRVAGTVRADDAHILPHGLYEAALESQRLDANLRLAGKARVSDIDPRSAAGRRDGKGFLPNDLELRADRLAEVPPQFLCGILNAFPRLVGRDDERWRMVGRSQGDGSCRRLRGSPADPGEGGQKGG